MTYIAGPRFVPKPPKSGAHETFKANDSGPILFIGALTESVRSTIKTASVRRECGYSNFRFRDGFQMAAGWMGAGLLRPGRRLKAPEDGNRGQQRCAMEI